MSEFTFLARSLEDTDRLGGALAKVLPPGSVVGLIGTLGSGKTRLVQSVAAALGNPPDLATSPTFVLVNEYTGGRLPVFHFDVYRLRDEDEFLQLGPEEYFEGPGLTFIEWADRVGDLMPATTLVIRLQVVAETGREFILQGSAAESQALVAAIAVHLADNQAS